MTTLRLTNTFSNELEPFEPLSVGGKEVRVYSCGPTVYSFAHIGNFRSFLVSDVLRRTLERFGYSVRHVMNITDVGHLTEDHLADATGEDKLSKAARELGRDPYQLAQHYIDAFEEDAKALRLRNYQGPDADDPTLHPRATDNVAEMLAMIQTLIARGHAYPDSQGQVYFSIESFPDYGKLSHKDIDELIAGARVDVRSEKRDPRDFALWKVDPKHLMQWDPHSPDGWNEENWARFQQLVPDGLDERVKKGFPGWHIECSAMSNRCLGETIDIHTGGEDNLFPHHECENAQTCGALGTRVPGPGETTPSRNTFARFWLHGRHLLVDGRKMSKSEGTFFTVRDLLDPKASGRDDLAKMLVDAGFEEASVPTPILRLALMWGHYRQQMNFSIDMLVQSRAAVGRLQSLYDRAVTHAGPGKTPAETRSTIESGLAKFDAALGDDLQVERAIAAALDLVDQLNRLELDARNASAIVAALDSINEVLDVLAERRVGSIPRSRLEQWLDPSFCKDMAASLGTWRDRDDLSPVLKTLTEGTLPGGETLSATSGDDMPDALIELFIAVRQSSRKSKDFATADAIRDELKKRGVVMQDSPDAIQWSL